MDPNEPGAVATQDPPAAAPETPPTEPAVETPAPDPIAEARDRLERGEALVPPTETGESTETPAEGSAEGTEGTEGTEGAEGEQTGEGEQGAETPAEFTVTLEGLDSKGEKPLEVEAPDEETYNRLNRLQNEAKLGRNVREEQRTIQQSRNELTEVKDMMAIDPTGFFLDHMPEGRQTDIVMQLLFDPKVLEGVQSKLREAGAEGGIADVLDNEDALRTLRAELRGDRLQLEKELRTQSETRKTMQANADKIMDTIHGLIPEHIVGDPREQLFRDAVRDVKERCDRLKIDSLDEADVRLLVNERFRRQGITMSAPREASSNGETPAPAAAPGAGRTAEQFKQTQALRRSAAAAAPPGAGTPAVKPLPDLPKGTESRIEMARKVGLRRMLGRT